MISPDHATRLLRAESTEATAAEVKGFRAGLAAAEAHLLSQAAQIEDPGDATVVDDRQRTIAAGYIAAADALAAYATDLRNTTVATLGAAPLFAVGNHHAETDQ
ncbi:MAG TPA: hypothetical protein DCX34_03490 [Roseovarius sp.]|nr:hypothetical protein [Roseovarius sp.]